MTETTNKTENYDRLVEQETLIADATELICEVMEKDGVTRHELAKRLGKSKGFISQILTGERNMTLRTLADVMFALGHRFELTARPLTAPRTYSRLEDQPDASTCAPADWKHPAWRTAYETFAQEPASAEKIRELLVRAIQDRRVDATTYFDLVSQPPGEAEERGWVSWRAHELVCDDQYRRPIRTLVRRPLQQLAGTRGAVGDRYQFVDSES
jgi:transcriptional regulator with XRE-family HTH domain